MIKTTVARRYAQALFELLDQSTIEATRGTLTGLGEALKESAQLRHVVASPAFGVEDKIAVLTALGEERGGWWLVNAGPTRGWILGRNLVVTMRREARR